MATSSGCSRTGERRPPLPRSASSRHRASAHPRHRHEDGHAAACVRATSRLPLPSGRPGPHRRPSARSRADGGASRTGAAATVAAGTAQSPPAARGRWRDMRDTELFLSLAEIAGVFVGFEALMSIRSGGVSDAHEVTYMRCRGVAGANGWSSPSSRRSSSAATTSLVTSSGWCAASWLSSSTSASGS